MTRLMGLLLYWELELLGCLCLMGTWLYVHSHVIPR